MAPTVPNMNAACPNGGIQVQVGLDDNYPVEVQDVHLQRCAGCERDSRYRANGTNGTDGAPGPQGPAGANGSQGPRESMEPMEPTARTEGIPGQNGTDGQFICDEQCLQRLHVQSGRHDPSWPR